MKSFPENFIPPQEPLRSPLISSVGAKNSLGHKETKGEPNTAQIFLILQNIVAQLKKQRPEIESRNDAQYPDCPSVRKRRIKIEADCAFALS